MSKFNLNLPKTRTLTENLAGGEAYSESNELVLISILLTSFVNDQFYRSANNLLNDIRKLISKIEDKEFIAKAAIFARTRFNMRSITHVLAAELTSHISGKEWAKNFYEKIIVRVDDMSEIISYYLTYKTEKDNPKFPNALKKGFAKAFNKFDEYNLSKYRCEEHEVKLIDVVNIVHPIPNDKNAMALNMLVNGELKNTETWESKLSKAGQIAESEESLNELKSNVWKDLISNKRIGYFALLRNLRNIINHAPDCIEDACKLLTDENLIKKSKVLPFRFSTAYDEIIKLETSSNVRDVLIAINEAVDISLKNVPKFDGETLVVIDTSGSMCKVSDIASLFGAVLAKANKCDVMTFATYAEYKQYNPMDSVMTIKDSFKYKGGGTNFRDIFIKANKAYDNIIILSDMQGWIGYTSPSSEFNKYKQRFNCNTNIFSWDLAGYGTLQFPEKQVYCIAGFSDKAFDIINLLKMDKRALINEIKSISLS